MSTQLLSLKGRVLENWKSGLTVALVSIPLSISLAIASGASPMAGILTAVYAGAVASLLGSSNYNIVGPAGALSGILAAFALTKGAEFMPLLALVSGIFILIFKIIKIERYLVFIPESTIFGFTLGVAITIAANQINFALGLRGLEKHEHFIENVFESIQHITNTNYVSFVTFSLFLGLLFFLLKKAPKVPGAIIVSVVGIVIGLLANSPFSFFMVDTLKDFYPTLQTSMRLPFVFRYDLEIIFTALTISIIAIIETMISARIADGITKTRHNKKQEIIGLGVANILSGLLGGLPATAVFARTSINIKAGANHKSSAFLNTIFVFIISFFLLSLFKFIPMSAIAAILVFAAIRMIETHKLSRIYQLDKRSFAIGILVCAITVFGDAIYGIMVGTLLSLIYFVEKMTHGHFSATVTAKDGKVKQIRNTEVAFSSDNLVYSIKGPLSYMNGMTHLERFEHGLNGYKNIFIRLKECTFIDVDGAEILDQIVESVKESGRSIALISNDRFIDEQIKILTKHASKLKRFRRTNEAIKSFDK